MSSPGDRTAHKVRDELLHAAVGLLGEHGPDALQARKVSAASADDQRAVIATATQLWAMIHGFVILELADYLGPDGYAVGPVLFAMLGTFLAALGDEPANLAGSLAAAGLV